MTRDNSEVGAQAFEELHANQGQVEPWSKRGTFDGKNLRPGM